MTTWQHLTVVPSGPVFYTVADKQSLLILLNSNPDAKNCLEHFWNVKYSILGDNEDLHEPISQN